MDDRPIFDEITEEEPRALHPVINDPDSGNFHIQLDFSRHSNVVTFNKKLQLIKQYDLGKRKANQQFYTQRSIGCSNNYVTLDNKIFLATKNFEKKTQIFEAEVPRGVKRVEIKCILSLENHLFFYAIEYRHQKTSRYYIQELIKSPKKTKKKTKENNDDFDYILGEKIIRFRFTETDDVDLIEVGDDHLLLLCKHGSCFIKFRRKRSRL